MTKLKPKSEFRTLEQLLLGVSAMVRPPERLTVSEAATKYRKLDNPGAYVGDWMNDKTPYLVEIMDTLTSQQFTGEIFVGPARVGKTDILYNWLTHGAICDPGDMIIYDMTREVARDRSQGDLGKAFRHTKALGEQLLPGRQNDNVFDKIFKSGMRLLLRWPTITELSGKTLPRVWFADYDRMEDDIAKEGPPFDLGRKRTTTYKRFGMTVAESSPGREVLDAKWTPKTPHQAPPTTGILSLYNRGDRRRWYWRCPHCDHAFEPDFKLFDFPAEGKDLWERAQQVTMICPSGNGCVIEPRHKKQLNLKGRWIKEGMTWNEDGSITGTPIKTDIASFWLKGPAAAFQTWESIVFSYLQAKEVYDTTGDEGPLKKTTNTDQGLPYVPKAMSEGRLPETLQQRAKDWGGSKDAPVVPEGVLFLIATVDVQGGARSGFVVQVTGFGVGNDAWVIDMFRIRKSKRLDEAEETLPMDPAAYLEDWDAIVDDVLEKTYPLADNSGRRMPIKLVACDYGGEEGVSAMARDFWRNLRKKHGEGYGKRFQLVKGEGKNKDAPAFQIRYPDANQKDKFNAARGDVPVAFINSLEMKDALSGFLGRTEPAGGRWNFPLWAPSWFYSQMTSEIRTAKGWEKPSNHRIRNESWDLSYYALSVLRHPEINTLRPGFWDNPPPWAQVWEKNTLVFGEGEVVPFKRPSRKKQDLAELAKKLA